MTETSAARPDRTAPEVSIIMLSFNTRDLTRRSLAHLIEASANINAEIIVVDNASHDGSAAMIEQTFPQIRLIRAPHNLGFAGGNNLGATHARGDFLVLVNSDAFIQGDALALGLARMQAEPKVGLAGGLLIGKDGQPEPSARCFPSALNDLLSLSGLAARYPRSRFFGRFDRGWADPHAPANVDWVPGAFCLIRKAAIDKIGFFDERYFLYYEEVDLCRRLKKAGWRIAYWPDLVAEHWGGESSKTVSGTKVSQHGRQLTLWRMRSALLYYRRQHGWFSAWMAAFIERNWHRLRRWRNRHDPAKREESRQIIELMKRAWHETRGGRVSPARPW